MRLRALTNTTLAALSAFVLAALAACEKSSSPGNIAPPPDPAPGSSSQAIDARPKAALSASAAVAEPRSPAPASASATGTTASSANANTAAPSADGGKPKGGAPAPASLKPASKRVSGKNFTLDLASPGCKAASDCVMTIKLVASGDYHVNKEYPYKFIANAAPDIAFLGKGEATTFTRAAGDFTEQGEKTGTMTVRFKPSSPGDATVAGTYKFSVCSADQCQVEQERIDLAVPVL